MQMALIASATENITGVGTGQTGGLALDGSGNVYVADGGNDLIRKITRTVTGGVESWYVTTLGGIPLSPGSADGTGAAAQFKTPCAVAVDASGNVYVADTGNNTIRMGTPYQAPVANNATAGAVLGQAITFTLPATDAGGFSLTYAITGTTGGTATLAGNQATFTPSAAGTGIVNFTANDRLQPLPASERSPHHDNRSATGNHAPGQFTDGGERPQRGF